MTVHPLPRMMMLQGKNKLCEIFHRTSLNNQLELRHMNYPNLRQLNLSCITLFFLQNFEPVPYPKKDYGKFYTGDSYIVLNVSH